MDIGPIDIIEREGLPVTTVPRTLIDLGTKVSPWLLNAAVDDAVRRGLTTIDEIADRHRALARRGRDGVGPMRTFLEERAHLAGLTESVLESRLLDVILAAGLPLPELQYEIRDGGFFVARVDMAYPQIKLGMEADSEKHHGSKDRFVHDRERRDQIEALGWSLMGFTWWHVTDGRVPAMVNLRRAIVTRGGAL
jgi:hypothetical protein